MLTRTCRKPRSRCSGFGQGTNQDFDFFAVRDVYIFEEIQDAAPEASPIAAGFGFGDLRCGVLGRASL
jgi:hypothetical protein